MKWVKGAKLKAASQEERIQTWKEHSMNLLGNSPTVTENPITKIINHKQDITLGQFAEQNNPVKTNHIKARIDKTQQNSKYRLSGDRDETINHTISERSKLAQKEYKTRHDWVGKVIHGKMCKKFKFDHTNKRYLHNPAPVLENVTHKLLWDFDIHTDHLILARRPELIIINKKKRTCKIVDFAVLADHRIKNVKRKNC